MSDGSPTKLGHASPVLTLRCYTHALREEEVDLSFADFEVRDGSERLYSAPASDLGDTDESAPDTTGRGRFGILEHETGPEPATPTLAISFGGCPATSRVVPSRLISAA